MKLPILESTAENILDDVLRQREAGWAEDARDNGRDPSGFAPEEVVDQCLDLQVQTFICSSGRTSTEPP